MDVFGFCFYLLGAVLCVWRGLRTKSWEVLLWIAATYQFLDDAIKTAKRVWGAGAPAVKAAVQIWS